MTTADQTDEDLLENFPLSATELNVLLRLYHTSYTDLKTVVGHDSTLEERIPELKHIFQYAVETVFLVGCQDSDERARFLEACVSLCGRRGERFLTESLFSAVEGRVAPLTSLVFRLACACHDVAGDGDSVAKQRALANSSDEPTTPLSWADMFSTTGGGERKEILSRPEWREYVSRYLPSVHKTLSTVFQQYLFGRNCAYRPCALQLPKPEESLSSLFWNHSTAIIPTQLALMDLGGKWRRIFCSELDGLSFRTFHEALIGFCGPTLILIQTNKGEKLGYFTEVPWKSSPVSFTGQGESFLFRLHPEWSVYHAMTTALPNKYHQVLNPPVAHRKDCLVGLAVGGIASDHPRLHITETLERCKACSVDSVFESGPLLADAEHNFFDVDILEVWSVRVDDAKFYKAKESGKLRAEIREGYRQNAGSVDRAQFLDDFQTGIIPNHLYAHREQARGRVEFVASDDEGTGYFVQGKEPSLRQIRKVDECSDS